MPKLKAVKARLHREYSGQIKSAIVSQVSSEKYYVSILVETEHKELAHTNHNIGIDLGIKDLCITSDGKVYESLKIIKKYEKQLVKLQRQLSHKGKRDCLNSLYIVTSCYKARVFGLFLIHGDCRLL